MPDDSTSSTALLRDLIAAGVAPELVARVSLMVSERDFLSRRFARQLAKNANRMKDVRARSRTTRTFAHPPSDSPLPLARAKGTPEGPSGPSKADLERDLFIRGKQVLGQNAGGLIARLLKSRGGDLALARSVVEFAATKGNPRQYVGAVLAGGHASENGRRLTNDEAYFGVGREPGVI